MVQNAHIKMAAVLKSLRRGATVQEACAAANLARNTFYRWKKLDPDFAAEVDESDKACIDAVEGVVYKNALASEFDPRYQGSAFFFLKCRAPERWSERLTLNIPKAIAEMNDTELDLFINRLTKETGVGAGANRGLAAETVGEDSEPFGNDGSDVSETA